MGRIEAALHAALQEIAALTAGPLQTEYKAGNQIVTNVDRRVNSVLREALVQDQEGWLSEENADDLVRLKRNRVWIVDPIDGTRQFVGGVPEWSISIALVENGQAIAGGVCNPATKQIFLGSLASGVTYNGAPCRTTQKDSLDGALILASRDEFERGEWKQFRNAPFGIKPVGSIAYKLASVAAGLADATWTLQPKHEWDIAGGAALIRAAGGFVQPIQSPQLNLNRATTILPNLVAGGSCLSRELLSYLNQLMSD